MTHNPYQNTDSLHLRNVSSTPNARYCESGSEVLMESICGLEPDGNIQEGPITITVPEEVESTWEMDQSAPKNDEVKPELPTTKTSGSLWGHKDLNAKSSRTRIILLILLVFGGYGIALFGMFRETFYFIFQDKLVF